MTKWTYKGKEINSIEDLQVDNVIGFIYLINNKTKDKIYVGRKSFVSNNKVKLGKKELLNLVDKRSSKTKIVTKASNWLSYTGSNKELNADIKNGDLIEKTIIKLCFTKKQMTYWELHYQVWYKVLFNNSYNDNILGKFYRRDFDERI